MKLISAERPIERINTKKERQFTIKATGKAFRILSSGLYKEKIRAIVREISCNAFDAHILALTPGKPFDVHLPSLLEPFFSVRDYGPGLSDDDMNTVYTTYFESTKSESDAFIGALGLGSKSPLSYVDSFTAISYFLGWKRTYTIFWNEADQPSITLMDECESNQPSGLEVIIPVRTDSIRQFRTSAEAVYEHFPVPPKVVGSGEYKIAERRVVMKGDRWRIHEGDGKAQAIMGVVAYPLSFNASETLSKNHQAILEMNINIDFGIGMLDVTAGREELSFDRRTIENVRNALAEIETSIHQQMTTDMAACQTEFEARLLFRALSDIPLTAVMYPDGFDWNGLKITTSRYIIPRPLLGDFGKVLEYNDYATGRSIVRYKTHTSSATKPLEIIADRNLRIVIDDLNGKQRAASRLRLYRENNPRERLYVIRSEDAEAVAKIMSRFDGVPTGLTSVMEKPYTAPISRSGGKGGGGPRGALLPWSLDLGKQDPRYAGREDWIKIDVAPEDGGFYVPMDGSMIFDPKRPNHTRNFVEFGQLLANLRDLGIIDNTFEFVALQKTLQKKFLNEENKPNWKCAFTYFRQQFAKKRKLERWEQRYADDRVISRFRHSNLHDDFYFIERLASKLGPHPISKFVKTVDKYDRKITSFSKHQKVAQALGLNFKLEEPAETLDLTTIWQEAVEPYPMVKYAMTIKKHNRDENGMIEDISQYIVDVDKKLRSKAT